MKFDCDARQRRLENWHKHFCLFPRKVAYGDCRWLETVERKGRLVRCGWDVEWEWEYRALGTADG